MNDQQDNQRGLHELYGKDSAQADWLLWGRKADPITRRGFLDRASIQAMAAALGCGVIPFADKLPSGLIPVALAQSDSAFKIPGKEGLIVLNDRPVNAETPAHLLDDDVTPAKHLFVRNNGTPPVLQEINPVSWTVSVAGESCEQPSSFTIAQLKAQFTHYSYEIQLECGGNGRSEFNPPAKGNQWTTGAVGCVKWTGIRLRDLLAHCGIKKDAVYVAYVGADTHLSGDPAKQPISRGVPMGKALEGESLIAWAMNDADIPHLNGHPLRLICGGWPGSCSGKWLSQLLIRDRVHDGTKMTGTAYRTPRHPVAPGTKVPDADMEIIESMPVKSLITFPKSGIQHSLGKTLAVRGHAWAGDLVVKSMYLSIDFGATWQKASLNAAPNRLAWQRFTTEVSFPQIGYYEIWARAVDTTGKSQPVVLPGWNPKGYLNNSCHRIAVQVV
jgi:DMSO/TMAO reductase YedYZ molybdopterin-dependent catalytic subunit